MLWGCSATEIDLCRMTSADGGSGLIWREPGAGSQPLRGSLFVSLNRGSGEGADGDLRTQFHSSQMHQQEKITLTQAEPQLPEAVAWPTHRSLPSWLSPVWPHLPPTPLGSGALGQGQELCWAFLCEALYPSIEVAAFPWLAGGGEPLSSQTWSSPPPPFLHPSPVLQKLGLILACSNCMSPLG